MGGFAMKLVLHRISYARDVLGIASSGPAVGVGLLVAM